MDFDYDVVNNVNSFFSPSEKSKTFFLEVECTIAAQSFKTQLPHIQNRIYGIFPQISLQMGASQIRVHYLSEAGEWLRAATQRKYLGKMEHR